MPPIRMDSLSRVVFTQNGWMLYGSVREGTAMFSVYFNGGPRRRRSPFVAASIALGLAFLLFVSSAQAQQQLGGAERRFRSQPMLIPGVAAPTAVVRSLAFTQLGNGRVWLYSAGDDKLVRRWVFAPGQSALRMEEAQKIVWPVFRDMRGVIYAMDAENFGGQSKVAFGGFGVKPSQVNVVDVAKPDLAERLLHDDLLARQVVWSMDMLNDGNQCWLAVGYENTTSNRLNGMPAGLIPIWNVSAPRNNRAGRGDIELVSDRFNSVRFVAFNPTGRLLAVAGPDELGKPGHFALQIWDWRNQRVVSTKTIDRQVTGLGWLDNATCVAGAVDGIEFSDNRPGELAGRYITAIKSGGAGQVVLGVYTPQSKTPFAAGVWSPGQGFQPLPAGNFVDPVTAVGALNAGSAGSWVAAAGLRKSGAVPSIQVCVWKDGALAAVAPDAQTAQQALAPIARVHVTENADGPRSIAFAWGQRATISRRRRWPKSWSSRSAKTSCRHSTASSPPTTVGSSLRPTRSVIW